MDTPTTIETKAIVQAHAIALHSLRLCKCGTYTFMFSISDRVAVCSGYGESLCLRLDGEFFGSLATSIFIYTGLLSAIFQASSLTDTAAF